MRRSVVGVFDRRDAARAAIDALARDGFDPERIRVAETRAHATAAVAAAPPAGDDDGVLAPLRDFLARTFHDEPGAGAHDGAIVCVDLDDQALAPRAELALVTAGASDITHRSLP